MQGGGALGIHEDQAKAVRSPGRGQQGPFCSCTCLDMHVPGHRHVCGPKAQGRRASGSELLWRLDSLEAGIGAGFGGGAPRRGRGPEWR